MDYGDCFFSIGIDVLLICWIRFYVVYSEINSQRLHAVYRFRHGKYEQNPTAIINYRITYVWSLHPSRHPTITWRASPNRNRMRRATTGE